MLHVVSLAKYAAVYTRSWAADCANARVRSSADRDRHEEHIRDHVAAAIANFESLKLTDEQKTKIEEIRKEFRPKVHEAGNKLRAAVREEVSSIVNVLKG
jgi:Spy/CpxP family protein refolding chaperone